MYAKYARIVSPSPQGLAKMMEVTIGVCRAFVLTVSVTKTETISMSTPRQPRMTIRVGAAG